MIYFECTEAVNKQKESESSMYGMFAIIQTAPNWYQLVIIPNLYVISAGGDISVFFRLIQKYIRKYETRERLLRDMSRLSDRGKPTSIIEAERTKNELKAGILYADEIYETIEESLAEVAEKRSEEFKKRKARRIVINTPKAEKVEKITESVKTVFSRKILKPIRI